jgi:murein DD-endopeptidase MepM/ murein hydrolase activator NlpD
MANHVNKRRFLIFLTVILLLLALGLLFLPEKEVTFSEPEIMPREEPLEVREAAANLSELIWPLEGQVLRGVGLSYAQTFGDYRYHNGLDIKAQRGEEIVAALAGKVKSIETSKGFGVKLILDHGEDLFSEYAHLESVYLREGEYCRQGEPLGVVNQPGLNEILEGPHLHFVLKKAGEIIDPWEYLP